MVTEAKLYEEYAAVFHKFKYLVETKQRLYLAKKAELKAKNLNRDVYFEVSLTDVWVLDERRPERFIPSVKVLTFSDVNIEEIN